MLLWILPLFFLFALMSNRLRDAGRSSFQSIPAIIGAVFAKSLAGLVGMAVAIMPFFESFIQTRETITGIRMTLEEATQDQEVMDEFSNWLVSNADTVQPELFAASAWPSMIAFWIVIFAASQWYAKLPSRT